MRKIAYVVQLGCIALLLVFAASASAADWGSLKGRFVLDGAAGDPAALNVNKDVEYCGKHKLLDETIQVGDDGALGNVFVYLYLKRGKTVEIHPDLEKAGGPAVLDNKGCRFEPHVLLLRAGQELQIKNSDTVGHNTNFQTLTNPAFNETIAAAAATSKVFEKREAYPSNVVCNIHPWMKSFVLVRDNPYMAVSAADGSFEIKNLPAGEHEFIFWHEAAGNMKKMAVGSGKTSRKGRAKLKITAGDSLDLGEIKVSKAVLGQ